MTALALRYRATDTLLRLAGDEFTLILENLSDGPADAQHKAQQLLDAMLQPFALSAASVTLSSSIGIACYHHEPELKAEQLLTQADHAMYRAKRTGKNRYILATSDKK